MGLDPMEQAVLKKWKSLRLLKRYLERELVLINERCFQGELSLPAIMLDRMRFSKDVWGDYMGARYRPPGMDRPASIHLFPFFLLEKKDIQLALAHELVHHWEFETGGGFINGTSSGELDRIIKKRFPQKFQRQRWLTTHSPIFLKKSSEVAQSLGLPLTQFLFR